MNECVRGSCRRQRTLALRLLMLVIVVSAAVRMYGVEDDAWRQAIAGIRQMIASGDIEGARAEIEAQRSAAGGGITTRQSFELESLEFMATSASGLTGSEDEYMAGYRELEQRVQSILASSAREGDNHGVLDDCVAWQSLTMMYITRLSTSSHTQSLQSRSREMARSALALREALERHKEVLEGVLKIIVHNVATGMYEQREVRAGHHRGILSPRQVQGRLISSLEAAGEAGTAGAETLAAEYRRYATDYPTAAISGTYLNLAMNIEGKVDLDELCGLYDQCEERDTKQYHGAILGLSHLLCDAEQAVKALKYLDQIDEEYLPASRISELHFAKGVAYYQTGNHGEALRFFKLVTLATDRYESAGGYIDEILGVIEKEVLEAEDLVLPIEPSAEDDIREPSGSSDTETGPESETEEAHRNDADAPTPFYVIAIVGVVGACALFATLLRRRKSS